jgi:hypothetical protein
MKRLAFAFFLGLVAAHAADRKPLPAIEPREVASPAGAGAVGASLTVAPDGGCWLSWVEPGRDGVNTLRFSTLDRTANTWRAARAIAAAASITLSAADFPQLAIDGAGRALAVWTDGRGGAWQSESRDGGATWSRPAGWTRASDEVEKFSFTTLADGRILAAWLDGRGRKAGGNTQQLYARIVGDEIGDMLVDASVCDCCQTTLTAFPDGTALIAYRGRTAEEVRDIRVARFRGRSWDEPRPLNNDDWRITACPINGPRLASDGGRVAVAWFTAADNEPRVLASFSPDAGTRFLMPLRVDRGQPAGHADTLILHDGALLVTWTENDGSVWLRRINPDFAANDPVALAPPGTVATRVVPRLALVRDYAGGHAPAEFVAAFATTSGLRTLLVRVPEGELLDAEKNCDCTPTAEQLRGYPIRGTIVALSAETKSVRVKHVELPGLLAAGTSDFKVAADMPAALEPGRQFLGRIERRDGAWWLYDVRLLAELR